MTPEIASVVSGLIASGLPKVADAVVEKGPDYVQDKLGVELKPEDQLKPEDVIRLQEAALQHEEFIAELDEKSRQRATDMQIAALGSNDPVARRFIYYFAWFWSSVSVIYFFCVTFWPGQKDKEFANIILGFLLGTAVAGIIQFFYGSSKSSHDKTAALIQSQQKS